MADIERHALAMVREYLSRRGYKEALSVLDSARPPREGDITSRTEICQSLKLERLVKHNKEREDAPMGTMLELVVEYLLLSNRHIRPHTWVRPPPVESPVSDGALKTFLSGGSAAPSLALPPGQSLGVLSAPAEDIVALPAGGPLGAPTPAATDVAANGAEKKARGNGAAKPARAAKPDAGFTPTCSELPRRVAAAPASGAAGRGDSGGSGGGGESPRPVSMSGNRGDKLVVAPGTVAGNPPRPAPRAAHFLILKSLQRPPIQSSS